MSNKPSKHHGSTPIWCEIVCDTCATQGPGQFTYGVIPRASLKQDALKMGWYLGPMGFVECRKCRAKRKDAPPVTSEIPNPAPVVFSESMKAFLGANLIPGDHPLPGGIRAIQGSFGPTVLVFDEEGPEPVWEDEADV